MDLKDGETFDMQGSGKKPYQLKNVGGVYSCTCPAWRNQSLPIERRTCKHLRKLRGDAAEEARLGGATLAPVRQPKGGVKAPAVLLAEVWDRELDPTGWWMSEKLDGVRAWWNGETREFISRNGNIYLAPDYFIDGLPNHILDGEIWLGRKQFDRTSSIVRRQDKSDEWKNLRFVVFDAPRPDVRFEDRMYVAQASVQELKYASWHPHEKVRSKDHLLEELARIDALDGEGLMLREAGSFYVAGRSTTLLKVKNFMDTEAVVTGIQAGRGRHMGRMGALLVKLPDGTEFAVGTGFSDADREKPPAVGSKIKVKYQELTEGGVPRFPSYLGMHEDQD